MHSTRKDSIETCLRLIEAACKVFSEKDFKDARISDICELAGVNIALVNYHFGTKKNLYREAWRYAHRRSQDAYPMNTALDIGVPPEKRLHRHIDALLHHVDDGGCDFAIMHHELSNPTGLLSEIMMKELKPLYMNLDGIIRELLDPNATEQQVQFCHASIMGQCFQFIASKHKRPPQSEEKWPVIIDDIDAYIEHVVTFSLAGMKHMRENHTDSTQFTV